MEALKRHHLNYGPKGPKYLQLLWWEWPHRLWPKLINWFLIHLFADPPPQHDKVSAKLSRRDEAAIREYIDEINLLSVLVKG